MADDIARLGFEVDSSQATKAVGDLDKLAAAADRAEASAVSLGAATATAFKTFDTAQIMQAQRAVRNWQQVSEKAAHGYSGAMQNASMHTGNVFAQLNDISMMMLSGQNPLVLAMQQGTQLNQVWAQMGGGIRGVGSALGGALMSMINPMSLLTIGVIAGGAALVQWGMSALGAAEDAKTFDDALGDVQDSVSAMNEQMNIWSVEGAEAVRAKYGEINTELAAFIDNMNQITQMQALQNTRDLAASLLDELEGWESSTENLREIFPDLAGKVNHLISGLARMETAGSLDEQLDNLVGMRQVIEQMPGGIANMTGEQLKFYTKIVESEDAIRQMIAAQPKGDFLSSAIAKATELAGVLWDAASAAAAAQSTDFSALSDDRGQAIKENREGVQDARGVRLKRTQSAWMTKGGGGGGGGGSTDTFAEDLKRLQDNLMTERETIDAWYAESQTILNDRRALEIMGEQAHKDALLDLEYQYQEKLRGIKDAGDQYGLQSTADYFGELSALAGGKYEGLLRIQRSFAAASALVNTYQAASQALADPTLTYWQKFAAVAKVLAAGFGFVNAIKSGGSSSGGGGGGSGGATTSATRPAADTAPTKTTRIELMGDDWIVNLVEPVLDQVFKESKNGTRVIWDRA